MAPTLAGSLSAQPWSVCVCVCVCVCVYWPTERRPYSRDRIKTLICQVPLPDAVSTCGTPHYSYLALVHVELDYHKNLRIMDTGLVATILQHWLKQLSLAPQM